LVGYGRDAAKRRRSDVNNIWTSKFGDPLQSQTLWAVIAPYSETTE